VSVADVGVRPLAPADWPEVRAIYADGIATGHATFESEPPTWESFDHGKLDAHRIVAVDLDADGSRGLIGWAALSGVSSRCVYEGVVELSVYVAATARGRGVGRRLVEALVTSTEAAGIWTIQAGIFPENVASLTLHRAAGFRDVGVRRRLARIAHGPLAGQWRDVMLLERRSVVAGI